MVDNVVLDNRSTEGGAKALSQSSKEDATDTERGSGGTTGSNNHSHNQPHQDPTEGVDWKEMRQQEEELTQKQAKKVLGLKLLLVIGLVVSTVCAAYGVHSYTKQAEREEFQDFFSNAAMKVTESIGSTMDVTLGATDSLAVTMISYARLSGSQWPFVTMPDFYLRSRKVNGLSKSVWTSVYHLVTHEQRPAWENYTAHHNGWIDQDMALQATDPVYHGPVLTEYDNYDVIHDWSEYDKPDGGTEGVERKEWYLPTWQNAPVVPRYPAYNWDVTSIVNNTMIVQILEHHKTIISEPYLIPNPDCPTAIEEAESEADWFLDYIGPDEDPMEPVSDILYPMYDNVSRVTLTDEERNAESFVAIMAISIYWRDMIRDVLPPGSNGLIAVFDNPCTQSFTYRLDGPLVTYLGPGDHHDENYSELGISAKLHEIITCGDDYSGVPVNHEHCPYDIRLYPSSDMEDMFASNRPVVLTLVTVLIFAFTSAVFILYDCAASSNVSTLCTVVKKRTKALEESNQRLEEANKRILQASAAQLRHFACMR